MTDPAHPAWLRDTEVELRRALEAGLLDERDRLEVKRNIPQGKGARKETARAGEPGADRF